MHGGSGKARVGTVHGSKSLKGLQTSTDMRRRGRHGALVNDEGVGDRLGNPVDEGGALLTLIQGRWQNLGYENH